MAEDIVTVREEDKRAGADLLRTMGIEIGQITLHWASTAMARLAATARMEGREEAARVADEFYDDLAADCYLEAGSDIANAIRNLPAAADLIARNANKGGETATGFQGRVDEWLIACFGEKIARDHVERNHRFLEEALELVQACGCTASEAHQLVDYTFGRPTGERGQEVGGVMNTLAALCLAYDLSMTEEGDREIARCWAKIDRIRDKQRNKPKHSPLPASPPTPEPVEITPEIDGALRKALRGSAETVAVLPDERDLEAEAREAAEAWRIPVNSDGTGELAAPKEDCIWGFRQGFLAALTKDPT